MGPGQSGTVQLAGRKSTVLKVSGNRSSSNETYAPTGPATFLGQCCEWGTCFVSLSQRRVGGNVSQSAGSLRKAETNAEVREDVGQQKGGLEESGSTF